MNVRDKINAGEYETKLPYPKWTGKKSDDAERVKQKAYRDDQHKLRDTFKRDALEELEIARHPKAGRCWELAWEHGHSSGLLEVFNHLLDFSELMK